MLDLGLGKTYCSIQIARYRLYQKRIRRVLVVAPTSILYNWKKEVEKWSEYKATVLHGARDDRIDMIQDRKYTFYIINYEALHTFYKYLIKMKFQMGVFDETAKYIKTYNTKRTKASIKLADRMRYTLILTGTPITNKPLDLWSQFRVLDGGTTFSVDFFLFRAFYFNKIERTNKGVRWYEFKVKPKAKKYMTEAIYESCIRFKKEECLDLPPKIFNSIYIEPTPYTQDTYEEVERHVIAEIMAESGTATLTIKSIFTRIIRLQQLTSGFTVDEYGEPVALQETPKLDSLIEHIELITDMGEAVVVWCRFLKSIDLISERLTKLKIPHSFMSGQTKDKYERWKNFQTSKTINVFIAQIESGGVGTELFKKDSDSRHQYMIFYENSWSADVRTQAIDRIHRIGQTSTCIYLDLILKGTIDEKILDSLEKRRTLAEEILSKARDGSLALKGGDL